MKLRLRLQLWTFLKEIYLQILIWFLENIYIYYMAESVFAMSLVNLRSDTCYTDQKCFKKMLISEL